jgi:hypothetical protein
MAYGLSTTKQNFTREQGKGGKKTDDLMIAYSSSNQPSI